MTKNMSKKIPQKNPNKMIRLNRYLAICGVGSRRSCDNYIKAGKVTVNGETVTQMGVRIDPEKDVVCFEGQEVRAPQQFIYILMNKPLRTVTTVKDEKRRKTVIDLLKLPERLFPVGRLDYYTTGALLITNDGELAYYLMHPRFQVSKVYRVLLNKLIRPIDLHKFQNGVELDGRLTAPCKATELRRIDNRSYLEVELHEGRNRQIRRMFDVLGYQVEELHRYSFAGLTVNDLKPGEWRELTSEEIQQLKQLVESQKDAVQQELSE
ncbi:MAG: rRNA pseudouridine synthase [Calditrichaeota bacterium]|nr:MAG: rRNA pseudouridine synthase [Calditrichota bacterium]